MIRSFLVLTLSNKGPKVDAFVRPGILLTSQRGVDRSLEIDCYDQLGRAGAQRYRRVVNLLARIVAWIFLRALQTDALSNIFNLMRIWDLDADFIEFLFHALGDVSAHLHKLFGWNPGA